MSQVFGINSVAAKLKRSPGDIQKVLLRRGKLSGRLRELEQQALALGCEIQRLDDRDFDQLTSTNHQGVGLQVTDASTGPVNEDSLYDLLDGLESDPLLLVLDGVTDPRNLGACLRSAAGLGVTAVIVPKDKSAPLNDAAIKTASGAAAAVPLVQVVNLARCLKQLQEKGCWVVGTHLEAEKHLHEVDLKGPLVLVMGSEDRGIRDKTARTCDFLASIPMPNPEFGFNVSVATGICLYEAWRQRHGLASA